MIYPEMLLTRLEIFRNIFPYSLFRSKSRFGTIAHVFIVLFDCCMVSEILVSGRISVDLLSLLLLHVLSILLHVLHHG